MIQFNCKALAYILGTMRHALGINKRSEQLVVLTCDQQMTTVRVSNADTTICCIVPCSVGKQIELAVPMRSLASLPESARRYVTFEVTGNKVSLSTVGGGESLAETWELHSIPPATTPASEGRLRVSNSTRLGQVLHHAASVSDPESTRYSLGCIRLRGSDGQVAASDGRQVIAANGFSFPFDEVMVSGAVIGRLKCLTDCSSISVGLANEWLSISTANGMYRWMVDLRIQSKGRFPNIDMCIPRPDTSRTVVTISDADASFLLKSLPHLVGKCEELQPMTLDLSIDRNLGKQLVKLRFRRIDSSRSDQSSAPVIDVTLDESTFTPHSMQLAMDHHYLLTALRFGHRKIHLRSPTDPVFCHGVIGDFVWAPMHDSLTIGPTSKMVCFSTCDGKAAA